MERNLRIFRECNDVAFWADPAVGFARLFAAGERVLRAPDGALCIFGHAELTALARQPAVEGVAVAPDAFGPHGDLATFFGAGLFAGAGNAHRHARRAALAGLGVAPIAARAPEISGLVQQALEGCLGDTPFDLARDLVLPLTARVWAQVAGYPTAVVLALAEAVATLSDAEAEAASQAAAARQVQALTRVAWWAGSPFMDTIGDALPSGADPVSLVASMAVDGIDSAAAGLAGALAVLLDQPPEMVARHGPEPCLQEALRLAMPVILSMRQATEDTSCCGLEVPCGTVLWMWWGAGCMDPVAYSEPARFLPARPGPRAPVFGAGVHSCLGHALIRTVALPLIAGVFGGSRHLLADGPARLSQLWRLSRLPQQRVVWSGARPD